MATNRIESLDGLRALAASLIVVFHMGLAGVATSLSAQGHDRLGTALHRFGASGVELFFTLSAVVLLRPDLRSGRRMDVGAYAWRRVTRLWPPFLGAWLLAGVAVAAISAHPTWWPSALPPFSAGGWAAQAFIVHAGPDAYNFAWWTLTIELSFYALAPALVRLLAGRPARATRGLFAAALALSLAASPFTAVDGASIDVARFLSFASCFAGGLLLARQDVGAPARSTLALAGTAVILGSALAPRLNTHVGYGLLYMALVSQAMDAGSRTAAWLSRPGMIWLGERSYSLFLTHYSVIALACWATSLVVAGKGPGFFVASRTLAVAGSIAVACVLFEAVESRFARGLVTAGQWWPGRRRRAGDTGPESAPAR